MLNEKDYISRIISILENPKSIGEIPEMIIIAGHLLALCKLNPKGIRKMFQSYDVKNHATSLQFWN
jgi:hypothetical protein